MDDAAVAKNEKAITVIYDEGSLMARRERVKSNVPLRQLETIYLLSPPSGFRVPTKKRRL